MQVLSMTNAVSMAEDVMSNFKRHNQYPSRENNHFVLKRWIQRRVVLHFASLTTPSQKTKQLHDTRWFLTAAESYASRNRAMQAAELVSTQGSLSSDNERVLHKTHCKAKSASMLSHMKTLF